MRIAFFSESNFDGKISRDFDNMRVEYAWYVGLDATHHYIGHLPSMDENKISIHIGEIKVYENGKPLFSNAEKAIDEMYGDTVIISIDLNDGDANAVAWGCDLTQEYVKINSEYTT